MNISNIGDIQIIRVSNILGEVVQSFKVNGNNAAINVSKLSKGVYFISMLNEKGISSTKKFVKE